MSIQYEGAYLILKTDNQDILKPSQFDPVLNSMSNIIQEYSYITCQASTAAVAPFRRTRIADKARITSKDVSVYAAQPNVFDSLLDLYTRPYWTSMSALSYGEQLYTAKGSQSAGVGHYVVDVANIDVNNYNQTFLLQANKMISTK
jgi:hypothetical protein